MKTGIFQMVRGGTERFSPYAERWEDLELIGFDCPPTLETLELLKTNGCEAMIYMSDHKESEAFFQKLAECGVKYVCCCSAGYDHFDLAAMKKYGLKGANVPVYSPNAIAEHTVMLVLAALRNLRKQILNVEKCSYQLKGVQGKEIRNMTIGVVGAGRIGSVTIQCLSGFQPKKIVVYDPHPNDAVKNYAEYTSLDELYTESDVIIYHAIYNESNHHMVNDESIASMKDGVVLVNSSRGGLFDAQAVLRGIESGKLGAVCMDVIEEEGLLRKQSRFEQCPIQVLEQLLTHDNFIFTPHSAFYTDEADRNLTEGTIRNLVSYMKTGACENELIQR
jgi:D-lactate dehydrogenase